MRKHLEHFWWKASDMMKNLMVAIAFAALMLSCLTASAFWFWLQGQLVNYIVN